VQAALLAFGSGLGGGGGDGGGGGGARAFRPAAGAAGYPALATAAPFAAQLASAPALVAYPSLAAPPALPARAPLPLALGGATLADGYRHDDGGDGYAGDGHASDGYGAHSRRMGRPAPAYHPVVVPPLVPPAPLGFATDAQPPQPQPPPPPPPFAFGGAAVGFAVPPPLPAAGFAYPPSAQPPSSAPTHSTRAHAASRGDGGGGGGLRTLRLPSDLSSRFLELARPNTLRNVETCGVLAGAFVGSELVVSHVLIPDQTGSSDACATTEDGENALCRYQLEHELITLGWVHTHPSQTCFFSSVDLHTQCGYQSMLDEAIGIVLAPRSAPSVGIFRLTTPTGLGEVQCCRERGFHPQHQRNGAGAGNGVYSESEHVVLSADVRVQLVDMRGGGRPS
jgi:proteasome lid subunit RPN8/RPN11